VKLLELEDGWHVSFEDHAGNHRVVSLRTREHSTAETIASVLVSELSTPAAGVATPTVEKVFRDWLKEKECEVGAATLDFYRQTSNGFLQFLGTRAAADIRMVERSDVINYRAILSKRLAAKTVNHRIKTLRSILSNSQSENGIFLKIQQTT
jgi:hypothetical protein